MKTSRFSPPKGQTTRDFLTVFDLTAREISDIISRAMDLKAQKVRKHERPLAGRVLGLLFDKPSTRTRVSFETAMLRMGGTLTFLSARDLQIRRGEPLKDTARVLSRYLDCLVVRTFGHEIVEELAEWASIPVINGLTDGHHPCQALSDIMTVMEKRGMDLRNTKAAWIGDGNNVAHSWIETASRMGFAMTLACPEGYEPDPGILAKARAQASAPIEVIKDPVEAVRDAHVINTDVWASMGQEDQAEERRQIFMPYQVNEQLVSHARPDAIVLHCLPAHRGEEITEAVLEGPKSVVWDQAENKMHLHKALLEFLILGKG